MVFKHRETLTWKCNMILSVSSGHGTGHGSKSNSRNISAAIHIKLLPLTTVGLQSSMCAHVNWFLGVCPCSLSIGPSFHCVSFSFTSLALWTSHTSEVTSKHASPLPGAIKSLRQWKTGEEKWLHGSLYSHWLFNPSVVPPKGEYEEILMYFIKI